jgi:hypothetical protein
MMARAAGDSPLSREILQSVRKRLLNVTSPAKKARSRSKKD